MRRTRRLTGLPDRTILVRHRKSLNFYRPNTMRTLSFDPTDRRYERIYAVLVTGEPVKDRTEGKTHGAVLDKLENIGQPIPLTDENDKPRPAKRGELRFYETVGGGTVGLEEAEYELVKDRMTLAIRGSHVSLSRETERIVAWLEGLPKQDAVAAPASA